MRRWGDEWGGWWVRSGMVVSERWGDELGEGNKWATSFSSFYGAYTVATCINFLVYSNQKTSRHWSDKSRLQPKGCMVIARLQPGYWNIHCKQNTHTHTHTQEMFVRLIFAVPKLNVRIRIFFAFNFRRLSNCERKFNSKNFPIYGTELVQKIALI